MAERPPVQVVSGGSGRRPADLLVGGSVGEPGGWWRRLPARARAGLVVAAAVAVAAAGALVLVMTGAGRPPAVPPLPLAALGPAAARVDDGGLLVRVEAQLRTREPVVLRSGAVSGGGFVVLVDPVPTPEPGAPDAVVSRVVAVVDPGCPPNTWPGLAAAVLQVVVAPQDGGEATSLTADVPQHALGTAVSAACAPVRASAALPAGSGPAAGELDVTVRVPEDRAPVRLLSLTGRGFQLDVAGLDEQVAAASGRGRPFAVTAPVPVAVTDCVVEVQAPRRLVLEAVLEAGPDAEGAADVLRVPVAVDQAAVAALDELVRQTCRRARG